VGVDERFLLIVFVIGSGQGVVCYCLGLSLLRKESGRVFVMTLQFDSYMSIRDFMC